MKKSPLDLPAANGARSYPEGLNHLLAVRFCRIDCHCDLRYGMFQNGPIIGPEDYKRNCALLQVLLLTDILIGREKGTEARGLGRP